MAYRKAVWMCRYAVFMTVEQCHAANPGESLRQMRRICRRIRHKIEEGDGVVMAACGGSHTLVVTQDGGLWACGRGYDGQLGLNDEENRFSENRHVFERVGAGAFGGARVVAAAAGGFHSAAVTEDGALWTCLLYTSPSPRDGLLSRMPSSA